MISDPWVIYDDNNIQEAPLPWRAQRVRRVYSRRTSWHFSGENLLMANNHFYVMGPESYIEISEITQNKDHYAFKVIQGHRFLYQSKAHMRLPISG